MFTMSVFNVCWFISSIRYRQCPVSAAGSSSAWWPLTIGSFRAFSSSLLTPLVSYLCSPFYLQRQLNTMEWLTSGDVLWNRRIAWLTGLNFWSTKVWVTKRKKKKWCFQSWNFRVISLVATDNWNKYHLSADVSQIVWTSPLNSRLTSDCMFDISIGTRLILSSARMDLRQGFN